MTDQLARILPGVQKPARYVGGEYNEIIKDKQSVTTRVAFCFPDTYEIGMSNLGMRILYGIMNEMPGVWCERVFAPWGDMDAALRAHQLPLFALESKDPLTAFDLIAFTIGYEMSYTNILNMLQLAGIPLRSADRPGLNQLIIAGGTCAYNPEPLADFIDLFSLGEGEDLTRELLSLYQTAQADHWTKQQYLTEAAKLEGVYIPAFYTHTYGPDGALTAITPAPGAPKTVRKRIVQDLDTAYYPAKTIVPSTEIVHDRSNLEVMRGCIRGCRFCQAGFCYRPVRPRSAATLLRQAKEMLLDSGNHEITLSSLSTSDYKQLEPLTSDLLDFCTPRKINISLPSLRADNFSDSLMQKLQKVRKSGLTFAPEAGTQRLRDVINKNVTEEEILTTCATAFAGGWNNVKLYFMLGLPTETDEDVLGIAELVYKVIKTWKAHASNKKRGLRVHVSTAFFVPKPFTPFQWERQDTMEEYRRKTQLLKNAMPSKSVEYNWHDAKLSQLEGVLARGDRRLCRVLEAAVARGVKLDGWDEYFDYDAWMAAFAACGIDPAFYTTRGYQEAEVLPWDTIDVGVSKAFLAKERAQAYAGQVTPDCRTQCSGCGANTLLKGGCCDA